MRDLVLFAENRQVRRFGDSLWQSRAGCIHEDPDVPVALLARVMTRKDTLDFQFVLRSQGRNFDALARARFEPPAVVTTLHHVAVHSPVGQRDAAVWARVPHRKDFSFSSA